MRILYINDAIAIWGGIERILVEKANYLVEQYGYNVAIVTSDQGCHDIPFNLNPRIVFEDLGVRFHQQYNYHGVKRLLVSLMLHRKYRCLLKQKIREYRPDVIISMRVELVADLLSVKGDIPLIVESHSCCKCFEFEGFGMQRRLAYQLQLVNISKINMLISLTSQDACDWSRIVPKVLVIPNMVKLNPAESYSTQETKSVIFVGRFSKQKNIEGLLKIWEIVSKIHQDWIINIYGEGELGYLIEDAAKRNRSIIVHAPTSEIFECYLNSSILLLTSIYEPFGLVLPEAMSCGLPVVSFDSPYGPADIITDGVDGYLIKKYDNNEFANRVCQLIADKELRMRMGQAAIKSSQRYRADVIMPKWRELFESLCHKE